MSSDYIPRLRRELLRAGAGEPVRRRRLPALRPAAVVAVTALLALAVVLALSTAGSDETAVQGPGEAVALTYRVAPAAAAGQTADVLRARLSAAGVQDAAVTVGDDASLTISAPAATRAGVTALVVPGELAIYDWEPSLLGSPGPVSRAEAEARAATRSDARVVRGRDGAGSGWFALRGSPAMTGADVAHAGPATDPATHEPIVTLDFTPAGQAAFGALTGEIARRGSAAAGGGADVETFQHLAIVLDDRVMSLPYIDFHQAPGGIDGSDGAQIGGGLTPESARTTAAILDAGPLPATLTASR